MAGDWIKVEMATPDKPEVFRMSEQLGIDPDEVTGKLIRFWIWANAQFTDCHASNVTMSQIDRVTYCKGFGNALVDAGWLKADGDSFEIPNFERHNGHSAKNRALATERKRKQRNSSQPERDTCHDNTVTKTGPEKRREEKSKKNTASLDQELELEDCYVTKKGRKLTGKRLDTFQRFWSAFDYKKGKAEAADAWFDIPQLTDALVGRICTAAEKTAKARPSLIEKGQTPKQAQGWLSGRRWEDEDNDPQAEPDMKQAQGPAGWREAARAIAAGSDCPPRLAEVLRDAVAANDWNKLEGNYRDRVINQMKGIEQ